MTTEQKTGHGTAGKEPVPMVKESTVKEDGRFLFYYCFPERGHAQEEKAGKEAKDV